MSRMTDSVAQAEQREQEQRREQRADAWRAAYSRLQPSRRRRRALYFFLHEVAPEAGDLRLGISAMSRLTERPAGGSKQVPRDSLRRFAL